jgi:hypothetical protein
LAWKDEVRHRERIAAGTCDPVAAWERHKNPKLTPEQVKARMLEEIESLKVRAAPPVEEQVDEEAAVLEEQRLREERLADNLRRMKSPVLVQRTSDGKTVFKHDVGVREARTSTTRD